MSAISSRKNAHPTGCLIAFFAIFALAGIAAFVAGFVLPMARARAALSWTPTPCTIATSAVVSRGSGEDQRFHPDVLYSYSFNGQSYQSNQYGSFSMGRKTSGDAQSLLNAFPPGAQAQCYVNPNDPTQAVLDRSIPSDAWASLLSLLFVAIGVGGITWQVLAVRAGKRNEARGQTGWQPKATYEYVTASSSASSPDASTPALGTTGEVALKPNTTRAASCIGLALAALFWNGIVGVFLWTIISEKGAGFFRIFMGLFLIPFVLVGIVIFLAAIGSFLTFFSSRVSLKMSRNGAASGESFDLSWSVARALFNPSKFTITLEGREEATYTRGTDTITDKAVFYSRELFLTSDFQQMANGRQSVAIPPGLMHSFAAAHNKVIWSLKVRGDVALWPDIQEEYTILVTPHSGASGTP